MGISEPPTTIASVFLIHEGRERQGRPTSQIIQRRVACEIHHGCSVGGEVKSSKGYLRGGLDVPVEGEGVCVC
jgi:hypothetical protein